MGFAAVGGLAEDADVGFQFQEGGEAPRTMVWSSARTTEMVLAVGVMAWGYPPGGTFSLK